MREELTVVHECLVCKDEYRDDSDIQHLCANCENEYAEWIEDNGFVIGEFDVKGAPNVWKGTKWEVLVEEA